MAGIAVTDETAAEIIEYNNAVTPLQIGNGAKNGSLVGVHHLNLGAMREVDTSRLRIERDVVKILGTTGRSTERDFVQKVITRRGAGKNVGTKKRQAYTEKNI